MYKYIVGSLFLISISSCGTLKDQGLKETHLDVTVAPKEFGQEPINCSKLWSERDRSIIERGTRAPYAGKSGQITVAAKVNPEGEVIDVTIDTKRTTATNKNDHNIALKYVKTFKFEPKETTSKIECGLITISLMVM